MILHIAFQFFLNAYIPIKWIDSYESFVNVHLNEKNEEKKTSNALIMSAGIGVYYIFIVVSIITHTDFVF